MAPIFVAYVDLAVIVGKLVNESILKSMPTHKPSHDVPTLLRQWIFSLPPALHLRSTNSQRASDSTLDSFAARQLLVTYYAAVAMFYRMKKSDDPFPAAAVLAGSTIAGIFEDFLARDQVRHLGPVYTFYLLVASIALLSCYKYGNLWHIARADLAIISHAQEEMKEKWPSAIGSIRSFDKMFKVMTTVQDRREGRPMQDLDTTARTLLQDIDGNNCRLYNAIMFSDEQHPDLNLPAVLSAASSNATDASPRMPTVSAAFPPTENGMAVEAPEWIAGDQMDTWILDESLFGRHLFWDDVPPDMY